MNYHINEVGRRTAELPTFAVRNNELVSPEKIYSRDEYPTLPETMVKIVGKNGQKVLIPLRKLSSLSTKDI